MPRRKKDVSSEDEDDFFDGGKKHKPIQRNAANARERARMRVLSKAFVKLKTTLPWVPADTKLSKLDTLRLASSYIAHLRQVLTCGDEEEIVQPPVIHPLNLTWPFAFSGKTGSGSEAKSPESLKPCDESVSTNEDIG
ncbi:hypothetical protein FSP39_016679 [Pinctada imbricata]|uniref:BHLH domain-containing protein n=1 Tax=Pinctada imbricata TaxID=66713 RepID=A0AA88XSR8_PINIB|nr:hypothetical protein FSP39_016679 [Pinctada imbricata]